MCDHTSRFIGTTRIRWNIKEALTLKECVKGSLNVGKFVDFIVLNQEIFELEPIDWLKTEVWQTFVNECCVYEAS